VAYHHVPAYHYELREWTGFHPHRTQVHRRYRGNGSRSIGVPLGISFHPFQHSLAVTVGIVIHVITFAGLAYADQSLLWREYFSERVEESPRPDSPNYPWDFVTLRKPNQIGAEDVATDQDLKSYTVGTLAVTRLSEHISFVYSPSCSSACLLSRTLLTNFGSFHFDNIPHM
jgi:hypothetical protein